MFFRGGYGELLSDRGGEAITDVHGTFGKNSGTGGYYIGGGAELMISKDLWGMMNGVALVGEIGLEFKRWAFSSVLSGDALTGDLTPAKVQLTMLTASVALKVKFRRERIPNPGSFQPGWISTLSARPQVKSITWISVFSSAVEPSIGFGKSCG